MEKSQYAKKVEQHIHRHKSKNETGIAFAFLLLLLIALVVVFLYFFNTPADRIFVVKINSANPVENTSKFFNAVNFDSFAKSSSGMRTALLVEEGDLLSTGNCSFYFSSEKDSFTISERGDSLAYMDGSLLKLQLKGNRMLPWLKKMTEDSIKNLQWLGLSLPVSDACIPYIEKIAQRHKNISLAFSCDDGNFYSSYNQDIQNIAKSFTPEALSIELSGEDLEILSSFQNIKSLLLIVDRPHGSLPQLPKLRQCIVSNNESFLNETFFENNRQIEKLFVISGEEKATGLGFISRIDHLKELVTSDNIDVYTLYKMAPDLSVLIFGDSCKNITTLPKFKNLKWLGLPRSIDQKQFDTVLNELPNLQVLEMYGTDSIKNIKAITPLKNLKGLVIAKQLQDSSTLLQCKQLRYLSVPEESLHDSVFTQKLVKALPGCIIVPNSGACLGSGWLLLLIPLVMTIIYLRNRYANASHQP